MKRLQIISGAIDPNWIGHFETKCLNWFEEFDRRAADPNDAASEVNRFRTQSGIPLRESAHTEQEERALLADFQKKIVELPTWRNKGPLYWLADMCSIRRQKPAETVKALDWHQDSAVVTSSLRAWRVGGMVAWIPITAIDAQTPGLQVIPYWWWPMKHDGNPKNGYLEAVHKPYGRVVTIDRMKQGDIALFDLNCPHRTHVTPSMTKPRLSIDLRVMRRVPKSYTGRVIPLAA
jgi:hypothetical protein